MAGHVRQQVQKGGLLAKPNSLNFIIEWLGARQVTFSGKINFPSKVPEFLHVLFN